jgi:hypothetical protein
LPFRKGMTPSVLQVLAWEVFEQTDTIQGKVAIWTTRQPVKSEHAIGFSAQGVKHNSPGSHENACPWWRLFRLGADTFRLRWTGFKDKQGGTHQWIDWLGKVVKEKRHEGVPRDGSKEHNEEVDQMDEVHHRFQGWWNDELPQVCPTRVNSIGLTILDQKLTKD